MLIIDSNEVEEITAGDNTLLRELLSPYKDGIDKNRKIRIRYSLAHARVQPGNMSYKHKLTSSEIYYILEGVGEMHIDDESEEVLPGQAIYIHPEAVQYIKNTGTGDLVFLCIVDPAWKSEDEELVD